MKKTAFLTSVTGQDGSYLAEYLLSKNYKVFGMIRRHSDSSQQTSRINHIINDLTLEYGDITDPSSVERLIRLSQPDEVYHLAGQSQVRIGFLMPKYTTEVNTLGIINVLEAIRLSSKTCKFYQSSSSEVFGRNAEADGSQRETTKMDPITPNGCTSLFCYNITKCYRASYKMFAVNGLLFNHESPRRGSNFVTAKIIRAAKAIKSGQQTILKLGNLDAARDWGHAKDYVRAMYLMMNHKEPDDFVIATGRSHSVREVCQYVFSKLGLDYEKHIQQDKKYTRPDDIANLKGDSSKAKNHLGWKPEYNFRSMLDEMIERI